MAQKWRWGNCLRAGLEELANLTATEFKIAAYFCRRLDGHPEARLSIRDIATTGLSWRTAQSALRSLATKTKGIVILEARRGRPARYRLGHVGPMPSPTASPALRPESEKEADSEESRLEELRDILDYCGLGFVGMDYVRAINTTLGLAPTRAFETLLRAHLRTDRERLMRRATTGALVEIAGRARAAWEGGVR